MTQEFDYRIVKNIVKPSTLTELETSYLSILKMQADKLCVQQSAPALLEPSGILGHIDNLVLGVNEVSHHALNECNIMLRNSVVGHKIAWELNETISSLFPCSSRVILSGPSLFINLPNSNTRKYTAHAESYWYPKRQKFFNLWLPVFRQRSGSESMIFWKGTENTTFSYFTEYVGYETDRNSNANKQYEIPNRYLEQYEKVFAPSSSPGDVLIFNKKLVHSSIDNTSDYPLYALTVRAFDYIDDLTVSANWAEVPYQQPNSLWSRLS